MKSLVFVSVAFGIQYIEQQDRLKKSILDIYPDANLLFYRDCLPPKSKPFLDSLYGFKVHAIKEAMFKGFTEIIWLDPAMILCREIGDTFKGMTACAVKDDHKLSQFISDKYLDVCDETRESLNEKDVRLVGGSLYYFNIEKALPLILSLTADEYLGYFGSQKEEASEQLQGHRADESCMAMRLYKNGIQPVSGAEIGYCVEENPIFIKKHFK